MHTTLAIATAHAIMHHAHPHTIHKKSYLGQGILCSRQFSLLNRTGQFVGLELNLKFSAEMVT